MAGEVEGDHPVPLGERPDQREPRQLVRAEPVEEEDRLTFAHHERRELVASDRERGVLEVLGGAEPPRELEQRGEPDRVLQVAADLDPPVQERVDAREAPLVEGQPGLAVRPDPCVREGRLAFLDRASSPGDRDLVAGVLDREGVVGHQSAGRLGTEPIPKRRDSFADPFHTERVRRAFRGDRHGQYCSRRITERVGCRSD